MAIIQFMGDINRQKGEKYMRVCSVFLGRKDDVYFVPAETLVILDSQDVKYKELKEFDLPDVLCKKRV